MSIKTVAGIVVGVVILVVGVIAAQLGGLRVRTAFQHDPPADQPAPVSLLHGGRSATSAQHATDGVAGRWKMRVGDMVDLTLELEQDGKAVRGTFTNPHGEMAVRGEFVDGALTLATVHSDPAFTLDATLTKEGTLDGTLVSGTTNMKWTAERAAVKH